MSKLHNVEHVSQHDCPESKLACGVAGLAMLLQHDGRQHQYQDLANELHVTKTPLEKGFSWGQDHLGPGVYFQDIVKWLLDRGIKFSASNIRTKQNFDAIKDIIEFNPVMAGVKCQNGGHWVVLIGVQGKIFKYLDPWLKTGKIKEISKEELFEDWDGTFIAIQAIK